MFDAGEYPSEQAQSRFVQQAMGRVLDPVFKEAMVAFFRRELQQIETIGRDLPPDDYLAFRRAVTIPRQSRGLSICEPLKAACRGRYAAPPLRHLKVAVQRHSFS